MADVKAPLRKMLLSIVDVPWIMLPLLVTVPATLPINASTLPVSGRLEFASTEVPPAPDHFHHDRVQASGQ